jgi:hypothetical protein
MDRHSRAPEGRESASFGCETKKEIATNATKISAKTTAKNNDTKRSSVLWMSLDDENKNYNSLGYGGERR